jgi:hypothetical protein
MPDRDARSRSFRSEALHEAPTEEAGPPEHANRGHGIPFGILDKTDASTAFHLYVRCPNACLASLGPVGKLQHPDSR